MPSVPSSRQAFARDMFGLALLMMSTFFIGCASSGPAEQVGYYNGHTTQTGPITYQNWQRHELYFGLAKPDGTEVSAAEFDLFVNEQVTSRFPDGLTLITTRGQWRGKDHKLIHENGRLLVILAPVNLSVEEKLSGIREAYKMTFAQDSVLIVTQPAGVSF